MRFFAGCTYSKHLSSAKSCKIYARGKNPKVFLRATKILTIGHGGE